MTVGAEIGVYQTDAGRLPKEGYTAQLLLHSLLFSCAKIQTLEGPIKIEALMI